MNKLSRAPKVENRYCLTIADILNLKVGNRALIGEPLFWWNTNISAWCISDTSDDKYHEDSFWLGIYSENAPKYAGEFKFNFTSYEGTCSYDFKEFYNPVEIQNEYDLIIQEKFLETINKLIDLGILIKQ